MDTGERGDELRTKECIHHLTVTGQTALADAVDDVQPNTARLALAGIGYCPKARAGGVMT